MSATESNLSASKYGYDMVVATTQDSINATMKEFLYGFEGQEFAACYTYDTVSKKTVLADYEKIKAQINFDPFEIPDRDNSNFHVQDLYKLSKFKFGFKATMGIKELPPSQIPDIVILDQGYPNVSYQLFCSKFTILVLDEEYGDVTWRNLSQDPKQPWIFRFTVNLDLRTGDDTTFSQLPQSVQDRVKNLNPNSAFSVQQLYLDLNTAGLQSAPDVTGLDKSSDAYVYLTKIFLNQYWDTLKAKGDALLGYTVKPDVPNPIHPSLTPTDLTIEVSPNLDAQGHPTHQYGLYTLDYLVMSNNHVLPAPVPFEWNWVEATEATDFHGAMAIKKDRFVEYLETLLSPSLKNICFIPSCSLSLKEETLDYGYDAETTDQFYRAVNDGTSKVLTFSYQKQANDESKLLTDKATVELSSTTQSDVYLENNVIRTVTLFTWNFRFTYDKGILDGTNCIKYQVETSYQINVDEFGNLLVSLTPDSKTTDLSETPSDNKWMKFYTLGQVKQTIKEWKSSLAELGFDKVLTGHDQDLVNVINSSSGWVFPGGKTFAFKNVYFSKHQDLITHIIYAEPD